jgi:glycine betaine/proline transport system substrate-binding protein
MGLILGGDDPQDAARAWLEENPETLGPWLEGVTTLDGAPGLEAVRDELGL